MDVVKKQVKTHRESIDAFTRRRTIELAQKKKVPNSKSFGILPKEMSNEELKDDSCAGGCGWRKEFWTSHEICDGSG